MNFTERLTGPNNTDTSLEQNDSSPLAIDNEIISLGPELYWMYQGLTGFEGALAIAGNLIALSVVCKFDFLRENNGCRFIASLALADFFGGIGIFVSIARGILTNIFKLALVSLCKAEVFIFTLSHTGNIYCYLLMTVDRFIFIERPLRYFSIMTQRRAFLAIVFLWMLNLVTTSSGVAWEAGVDDKGPCHFGTLSLYRKAFLFVSFIQRFILTFCILGPIYGKITHTAWEAIKTEPHFSTFPQQSQAAERKKRQERKMTITIAIMFGVYLLCNLPQAIYLLVRLWVYRGTPPTSFWIRCFDKVMQLVYRLQFLLNPIIYPIKDRMMRRAYKKMFWKNSQ